jgi:hypothetical protein
MYVPSYVRTMRMVPYGTMGCKDDQSVFVSCRDSSTCESNYNIMNCTINRSMMQHISTKATAWYRPAGHRQQRAIMLSGLGDRGINHGLKWKCTGQYMLKNVTNHRIDRYSTSKRDAIRETAETQDPLVYKGVIFDMVRQTY